MIQAFSNIGRNRLAEESRTACRQTGMLAIRRSRCRARWMGYALTTAWIAASCGSDSTTALQAEPATAISATVTLPGPKTLQERNPEMFDEEGCFKDPAAPGGHFCPAPAGGPIPSLPLSSEPRNTDSWGYVGPGFIPELPSDTSKRAVQIVADSVGVSSVGGNFYLLGLVRNMSAASVKSMTVSATAEGVSVSDQVLVRGLRSGEPGPFRIRLKGGIDPRTVAFTVTATPGISLRDFEIAPNRRVEYGDRPRAQFATLWTDPATGPMPLVESGSFLNVTQSVVTTPRVTMAWIDADGGVIWVETKLATNVDGESPATVDTQATAFYAFVLSGVRAASASAGHPAVWVDAL